MSWPCVALLSWMRPLTYTSVFKNDHIRVIINALRSQTCFVALNHHHVRYPEFKGNVAAVYTHPLSMGGSSGGHYNGNAETYMNVGEAMGQAMLDLLNGDGQ